MLTRRTAALAALGALLLGAGACTDALTPGAARSAPAATPEEGVQSVAKGIAAALASPTLRRQLFEDLRDSPFAGHSIHLESYLAGPRGGALASAAARALGTGRDELLALVAGLPDLQLSLPLGADRSAWGGTAEVVVTGHTIPRAQIPTLSKLAGFAVGGAPREIPLGVSLSYPLLVLAPAEVDFGADPEGARAAAPRKGGATVSSPAEERRLMALETDCRYARECFGDEPVAGGLPGGQTLPSGMAYYDCTTNLAGNDPDQDGIRNDCEFELATAFRPYLQFHIFDGWKDRQTYWAVKRDPDNFGHLKIFYAFSYFIDGGSPITGGTSHYGDSEFVIIRVNQSGGVWGVVDVFLSAHWHQYGWDSSSLRYYSEFTYPNGLRKRPKVWVAEGKHANYATSGKCDEGANYADNCDQPESVLRDVEILADRNLGNNETGVQLVNCVRKATDTSGLGHQECFWTSDRFTGWYGQTPDAGGYKHSLDWANF